MKRATQCGLFLAMLCYAAAARADAPLGDYKVILERNPFGLKPPPPPPPPPTNAAPETPTNYKLSGITALFNPPRAMFVNQVKPTPEYLSLSEGQRQGSLEVLPGGINLKDGSVRVKISGEERTMSFTKDGIKAAAGAPIMTAPGVPLPMPGFNPVQPTPGGSMAPSSVPVPQFNRPSPTTPQAAPAATPAIPAPPQLQPTPTRQIRTGSVTVPFQQQNQTSPPTPPPVDPVVQTVAIEVNRAVTKDQVAAGQLPPLPPTDLTGR